MKAPKKKAVIICSLSLLFVGFGMWFFMPRNGLLDHAVLIASGPEWRKIGNDYGFAPVFMWLNSEEALLFHLNADQSFSLYRKRILPVEKATASTPLTISPPANLMNASLLSDNQTLELDTYQTQWINDTHVREHSLFFSLKTGKLIREIPHWVTGLWHDSDSSFWDFSQNNTDLEVTNLLTGNIKKRALKTKWGIDLKNIYAESIDRSGNLIAFSYSASKEGAPLPPEIVVEFNINTPEIPARKWEIPAPPDTSSFNGSFSPTKDRILWDVVSNKPIFPYNLAQLLPGVWKPIPKYLERWMVSDIYGHGMHTIAEVETVDSNEDSYAPVNLEWNPDGKHVSFLHKDGLYLIPVK